MRTFFEDNSISKTIMEIIFASGLISSTGIKLISKNSQTAWHCAKRLVNSGYLAEHRLKLSGRRYRIFLASLKAKKELTGKLFIGDRELLNSTTSNLSFHKKANHVKEERRNVNIRRAIGISEEMAFFIGLFESYGELLLKNTSLRYLPNDRPVLSLPYKNVVSWVKPTEIKEHLVDKSRHWSSRAQGYLLTKDRIYTLYSMDFSPKTIRKEYEDVTNSDVQYLLYRKDDNTKRSAIIFTKNTDIIHRFIFRDVNDKEQAPYAISSTPLDVSETLFIPMSRDGQAVMAMVLAPKGREIMKYLVANEPEEDDRKFICDFVDGDEYVLNFLVPDLRKLHGFIRGISLYKERKGRIYTYEYQAAGVNELVSGIPNIEVSSFTTEEVINAYLEDRGRYV